MELGNNNILISKIDILSSSAKVNLKEKSCKYSWNIKFVTL